MRFLAVVMLVAACGDNGDKQVDANTSDAPTQTIDAAIDAPAVIGPRGPKSLELPGASYGLFWDNAASTLYITDDVNKRIDKWTDAKGLEAFGTLDTAAVTLGALVQLPDKSFLIPNLGQGTTGTIYTLSANGATAGKLTGLANPDRRRIGIALDSTGTLYESFFTPVAGMTGVQAGNIGTVNMTDGTETTITNTVAGGLKKVTGVYATATDVYVCEQPTATTNKLWKIALTGGTATVFPTAPNVAPGCDLFFVMPNGDLVTGGVTGGVYRIAMSGANAGTVTTLRSGFEQVRGIAYDPTMKRMFVVENRVAVAGSKPLLHVFPLDN